MSRDAAARRIFGVTVDTLASRIVRTFDAATASDIESGARWYPLAGELASDLARESGYSVDVAAAVISHLSPRSSWTRNVLAARALLVDDIALAGVMGRELARARSARDDGFDDLIDSFSSSALKTRSFYRNIIGDVESVTVDVWACRVAGVSESLLSRKGAYDVLEHAYRLAARRRGIDPSTMQAVTWIVARGGRAS